MPGNRRPSRGSGPRGQSRPGGRPRRGSARARAQAAAAPPPRPRLTGRAAVLVLVLAVLMVSYASSMRAYLEQRHEMQALSADIADSRANIKALEREKERWQDPAFVRAQARERFGWVLPGEVEFQVIDAHGKPLDHQDTLSDPQAATGAKRPLWWQSAWKSVEYAGHPEDVHNVPPPATKIVAPKSPKR